jgi:hypothetical protein
MNKKSELAISITLITLITLLGSTSSIAMTTEWLKEYRPYVGVDAQMRRMDFKGGYGDNLLRHNSPQGNFYAGVKLNDRMAVEAGYESTITKARTSTFYTGDVAAGMTVSAVASPVIFKSKLKVKGPHVDLVGFYSFGENIPVQLLGSVGASFFKGTVERKTIQFGSNPVIVGTTTRTLSEHKAVLRLMGGLQYLWDCNLGARATIGLVKTSKLVIFANDGGAGVVPEIKPKDSTVYGLGFFWVF